jgi:hypothetical protein
MLPPGKGAQTCFQGRQSSKEIIHRPTMVWKMSRNQAQTFAKWLQGHGAAKVGMPYMAVTPIRDAIGIKSNGNMTKTTPGTGGEKDKAGNF